ncbi:hypothetical protein R1flu_010171 [Riccia fluitans]|uniref:Uncharacterized protein n=1 Tax=Riccia fluitans TaxID=41844 RepID=A0ABD1Z492_9MARC
MLSFSRDEVCTQLDAFTGSWRIMRNLAKELQYAEVTKLRLLDKMRLELGTLANLKDQESEDKVFILAKEVARLQAWEEHRWRNWSRERYSRLGNTSSPYFLRRFRDRKSKARIQMLTTSNGDQLTDTAEIIKAVFTITRALSKRRSLQG